VTTADESIGERPAVTSRPGGPAAQSAAQFRLPVSVVAVLAAIGVLLAAAAYTSGRLGHATSSWPDRTYWLGQLLILTPVAAKLLSRHVRSAAETVTLVVALTVAEYLVKVCYSPAAYTYADELMHWRTATDIMQSGKLFTANDLLPISPDYPGLEEVTTGLTSVTGLSVFTSGLIVSGVAHLLFVCLLFVLFRRVSSSHRIAGVALFLYASESLFESFDSMFVYQTLAMSFFGLALLALCGAAAPQAAGSRTGWLTVAALAAFATVATHHVTSSMLVATLEVITLGALLTRNRRLAVLASMLALLSAAAFASWIAFVAPSTASYLRPVLDGTLQSFRALLTGGHSGAPPVLSAANGPLENQALAAAAVAIMSALVPVGWLQVWRRYGRDPWAVALAIGAVSWYVIVAIRLFGADGGELAGRASTFVFIPAAFIAALAVIRLTDNSLRRPIVRADVRRRAPVVVAAATTAALVLVLNGLVNGWPPFWERLPGPYQVAGAERSVGPEQIASADWALAVLGPGNRFATDEGDLPVLGSYGDQVTVGDDRVLYVSPTVMPAAAHLVQSQSIGYVLVDRQLSKMLPASGQYFPVDPDAGRYARPLPLADLTKFDRVPGVARIYDAGNIVVYDLQGSEYYGS
jgi:hypothetical protein